MTPIAEGALRKMEVRHEEPVAYRLPLGAALVPLNERLGSTIGLQFSGDVVCAACGRGTKRSFGQGYCYRCFTTLARCDGCIVKPELCHHHLGTCREPEWGQEHCMIPHTVYLANSSGVKVGITRSHQATTRWIDQGAAQALPIRAVDTRRESGLVEVALKALVSDRTDWRRMLRGEPEPVDLPRAATLLLERLAPAGGDAALPGRPIDAVPLEFRYPVLSYPEKVKSIDAERTPLVEGQLLGIKGQYLLLDVGVINVRKYTGYVARLR